MNPKPCESWQCEGCGRVYVEKDLAEKCCICAKCGANAKERKMSSSFMCFDCMDASIEKSRQERYDKAKKVHWRDYDGAGIYVEGLGSEYFFGWSPEEIIDAWEADNMEPFPGFDAFRIYGTYYEPIELDADELEERLCDGAYEDYEVDARMREDLERLCDEWNSKHGDKCYWPDETVAIVGWEDE